MTLRSSAALIEIHQGNVVRRLVFIGRMPGAAIGEERTHLAFAAELNPFTLAQEEARQEPYGR
jgi:hypothetical protein